MNKLHHLNLLKLVLTNHAASIATIAARFAAEARRMRHILNRQVIDNFIAIEIGDRHFSRGNQIELTLIVELKQILFKLRQLAGAKQRLAVNDIRYIDFFIAMIINVRVQHKLRQRSMQAGQTTAHHREP